MSGLPVPVTASLDRDGRLLNVHQPLLVLQVEAGGDVRGTLALPPLAALVRLAQRLRVPLSRSVELARDEADISLWVKLRPQGDGIFLSIVDWQERKPRQVLARAATLHSVAGWVQEPGWLWQVDDHMRFTRIDPEAARLGHEPPRLGYALTGYFMLDGTQEPDGNMPIIEALARQAGFTDQPAHLRADKTVEYHLSGAAAFDASGAFIGYRGRATPLGAARVVQSVAAPLPAQDDLVETGGAGDLFGPALGRRLDKALRQPLDRIIANAATISDRIEGPLRQDYANYATDIAAAGRHLLALVDDLADLQAIERPGFRPQTEEIDLAELARRAAGLLNVRAEARHVRIQPPATDERLSASGEYRRVLQILVNLIGNAVRHSPADSTIWIRTDGVDGRARVIVADQGSGIDGADHGRIFDRFERLGNQDGDGSGLGLYISRKLARAMGGDVTLESGLGRGARFTLDLPAREASRNGFKAG